MALFVNILTLIACFAAMAYCYILAKRIHAFHNIKDGVGALIEEMIRTTSDLQTAFIAAQRNIDTQYNKIQDKIDEGIALGEYLDSVLQETTEAGENLYKIKTELEYMQHMDKKQKPSSHNTQTYNDYLNKNAKLSTLPDEFQLQFPLETENKSFTHEKTIEEDPLEDVIPADFDSLKRKKRPKIILPGEEYL